MTAPLATVTSLAEVQHERSGITDTRGTVLSCSAPRALKWGEQELDFQVGLFLSLSAQQRAQQTSVIEKAFG